MVCSPSRWVRDSTKASVAPSAPRRSCRRAAQPHGEPLPPASRLYGDLGEVLPRTTRCTDADMRGVALEALVAALEHAGLLLDRGREGTREAEPVDVEWRVARHDDLARHLAAMLPRIGDLDVRRGAVAA